MIYILPNYDFIENEVLPFDPTEHKIFARGGLCFADKPINPDTVYVFHIQNNNNSEDHIFSTYTVIKKFNKSFLNFHQEVENLILSLNLPIFLIGKKEVFKNHKTLFNIVDGVEVYQYDKSIKL